MIIFLWAVAVFFCRNKLRIRQVYILVTKAYTINKNFGLYDYK